MMMNYLANGNPFGGFTGDQLMVWLAIGFAIIWGVEKGQIVIGRWKGKLPLGESPENPVYHRTSDRPVNWAELGSLERRVDLLEKTIELQQKEMTKEFAALRHEGELRATRIMGSIGKGNGDIHEKINKVVEAVAYMKGLLDEQSKEAAAKGHGKS